MKGDIIIRNNKKIDPEKYKQIKGVDIQLDESDSIVRAGKLCLLFGQFLHGEKREC
jgi:hypothetical protein